MKLRHGIFVYVIPCRFSFFCYCGSLKRYFEGIRLLKCFINIMSPRVNISLRMNIQNQWAPNAIISRWSSIMLWNSERKARERNMSRLSRGFSLLCATMSPPPYARPRVMPIRVIGITLGEMPISFTRGDIILSNILVIPSLSMISSNTTNASTTREMTMQL